MTPFTPNGEQQIAERRLLLGGHASRCLDLKSWPVLQLSGRYHHYRRLALEWAITKQKQAVPACNHD